MKPEKDNSPPAEGCPPNGGRGGEYLVYLLYCANVVNSIYSKRVAFFCG